MGLGKKHKGSKGLGKNIAKSSQKGLHVGGKATESIGYGVVLAGVVTGQPEIVGIGGMLVGVGKAEQEGSKAIRAARKGKYDKSANSANNAVRGFLDEL